MPSTTAPAGSTSRPMALSFFDLSPVISTTLMAELPMSIAMSGRLNMPGRSFFDAWVGSGGGEEEGVGLMELSQFGGAPVNGPTGEVGVKGLTLAFALLREEALEVRLHVVARLAGGGVGLAAEEGVE